MSKKHHKSVSPSGRPPVTASVRPTSYVLTRPEKLCLLALVLVAFGLRFFMLGRSALWQDEMILASIYSSPDESVLGTFLRHWDLLISYGAMPLAGTLQNLFIKILLGLGFVDPTKSSVLMRLPMVMAGSLAVPGVFLAARAVLDRSAAWCAALLMAGMFYPIYYSREAYCYAYILFFSSWALYGWLRLFQQGERRYFFFTVLCFYGLALSHMGAVVSVASAAFVAGLFWLFAFVKKQPHEIRKQYGVAALAPGLAFALVLPYLIHFALHNKAHIGTGQGGSLLLIWNDALNKMFLGERLLPVVLAWALWFTGLGSLFMRRTPTRDAGLLVGIAVTVGFILLGFATLKTQYISARYFAPLTALCYVVFGQGLWFVATLILKRIPRIPDRIRPLFAPSIALLCLIPQLTYYLPMYWPLEHRSDDFASVAQWLNEHLPPGNPYLLESAYQYRFIGGFHPTPGLIPLAPYVHGGEAGELRRLQEQQKELSERFPRSVFISLGHPGWDTPGVPWAWPKTHYRNHVRIGNEKLRPLIESGINPGAPYQKLHDWEYRMDLYYNTWTDRVEIARQNGVGVLFDYPRWSIQGQPVSGRETIYFRVSTDPRPTIGLHNVSGQARAGTLALRMALLGNASTVASYRLSLDDEVLEVKQQPVGQMVDHSIPIPSLSTGQHELKIELAAPSSGVQAVAIWDIQWVPDSAQETAQPPS